MRTPKKAVKPAKAKRPVLSQAAAARVPRRKTAEIVRDPDGHEVKPLPKRRGRATTATADALAEAAVCVALALPELPADQAAPSPDTVVSIAHAEPVSPEHDAVMQIMLSPHYKHLLAHIAEAVVLGIVGVKAARAPKIKHVEPVINGPVIEDYGDVV